LLKPPAVVGPRRICSAVQGSQSFAPSKEQSSIALAEAVEIVRWDAAFCRPLNRGHWLRELVLEHHPHSEIDGYPMLRPHSLCYRVGRRVMVFSNSFNCRGNGEGKFGEVKLAGSGLLLRESAKLLAFSNRQS